MGRKEGNEKDGNVKREWWALGKKSDKNIKERKEGKRDPDRKEMDMNEND